MLIRSWDKLPENIKKEEVRPYYNHLKGKTLSFFFKRCFDILVSAIMLILLSPLFLVVSVMIKKDDGGPIFYKQVRITQYGKKFKIIKFRTMVQGADQLGTLVTIQNDQRITAVGTKLRKYRIDEVPQLINVFKGEMTFVGTRPEVPKYVNRYTPEMMATLLLPAGVTSIASIHYKDEDDLLSKCGDDIDETYINDILPDKMKYNLEYLTQFSFLYELSVMIKTVIAVI